ncbi:MAG: hypothetical protein Q9190_004426 [Brigantiaea leucoxantha]
MFIKHTLNVFGRFETLWQFAYGKTDLKMKIHISMMAMLVISSANAHVKLETPVPYGVGLNTNPLLADGSDFPCKQRPDVYKSSTQNIMPVGEQQTISFQGQATHGGGSCQISLTTDLQPTKDSNWKVIKSIEGGCVSTNPGNVGTDPFGYGADKFHFAIPAQIAPGNYTLAWTWFNKIGNREMYMNCAPVTVPSSQKRSLMETSDETVQKRSMAELPNMFTANIDNGCSTAESGTVLAFPPRNLGKIVQIIGNEPLTPPVGNCGQSQSAGAAGAAGAAGSAQHPESPSSSAAAPSPAPPSSPPPPAPAVPQAASPQTSVVTVVPLPAQTPIRGITTGTCSTPGKSVCSPDGQGFGTCDQFNKVIFTPVPQGTRCDLSLGVEVPARKRLVPFVA